mmetsp:Transcript_8449/g.37716  ORF Transcript_8449/g.37716 Transcript_8449/m.37716 type:complete len:143 (+) Transcript_8449:859-1287(+)
MHVFAVEFEKSGKRLYVGASYSTFWKTYQRMKLRSQPLHFYEVIREGNSGKLYYDVEFSKDVNAERDGEKMVDDLLLETQRLLVHLFPSMMRVSTVESPVRENQNAVAQRMTPNETAADSWPLCPGRDFCRSWMRTTPWHSV